MAARKLLVTGATGHQGGAVIDALLASSSNFQILALTRDKSSPKAQSLASKPNVTVVEGDAASLQTIFEAHKPIYGVFLVTAIVIGKTGLEEKQAYPVIDASIKNNVQHFVFSSVDRGGVEKSPDNPTPVDHFASKYHIERYLQEKINSAGSEMATTILRPVCYMDNLTPDFMGKVFTSMWKGVGKRPLQLVSVHDIGVFAARAFADPKAYSGRAISLAGDALTLDQGRKVESHKKSVPSPEPVLTHVIGLQRYDGLQHTRDIWFRRIWPQVYVERDGSYV